MKSLKCKNDRLIITGVALAVLLLCANAFAVIPTIPGSEAGNTRTFNLTAKEGYITTPDGGSYVAWGYSDDDGRDTMQYPGPTLEINEGETVVINLKNDLCLPVSILFPGQTDVAAAGGMPGIMTREALPGGLSTVTYTFTAAEPGTYLYTSGSRPELQCEMGLFGAIIIRPNGFNPITDTRAYASADSAYDREYLFILSEMDPRVHHLVEMKKISDIDNTTYFPVNWFINGRCSPDTMAAPFSPLLPTQPYNCVPRMHPGERILLRFVGAGRDPHPFHTHGNNFIQIARDGRLLSSNGTAQDLSVSDFTQTVLPGATYDAIFQWTGENLGWDIYGHTDANPGGLLPNEYAPDHGKPFPVILPEQKDLAFGAFYSGSPFLGVFGPLPPGADGLNLNAGFFYMWHSHNEKEMVNNDIFPGGIMTMLIIEHPDTPIP